MTTVAILDYGMGNLRSVEKALERQGAAASVTRDHAAIRAADGIVLPGVGAFPKAMRNLRELGLDTLLEELVSKGVPTLGICLGMQLLFESSTENEGSSGLGFFKGTVERLPAPGLKVPLIGWNPVTWARRSALTEGLPDESPFYFVHSFAPVGVEEEVRLGVPGMASRSSARSSATTSSGCSSIPRSRARTGFVCSGTSPRSALRSARLRERRRRARAARDRSIPGGRHHGRQGGAADARRLRARDGLRGPAGRGRAALGRKRERGRCTSSTWTERAPVVRWHLAHLRRIVDASRGPGAVRRGPRSVEQLHAALAAGADRVVLGTAAFGTRRCSTGRWASWRGARRRGGGRAGRTRSRPGGWTSTAELSGTEAVAAMLRRGVRRFVYTNVDRDGMLAGTGPRRGGARLRRRSASERFVYSGGIGSLDDLRALALAGPSNLEGVIVGKALYERRFSMAEAQRALGR